MQVYNYTIRTHRPYLIYKAYRQVLKQLEARAYTKKESRVKFRPCWGAEGWERNFKTVKFRLKDGVTQIFRIDLEFLHLQFLVAKGSILVLF